MNYQYLPKYIKVDNIFFLTQEKQKVKQTITFEVFTKSISDKLNKLLSENINMKNKLEKLHLRKSKIKKVSKLFFLFSTDIF